MAWCPKCKLECNDDSKECLICMVNVESKLEASLSNDVEEFLTEVNTDIEADILENLLLSNHIPIMREYKEYNRLLMEYSWSVVRIYVPSKFLKIARKIIDVDIKSLIKKKSDLTD